METVYLDGGKPPWPSSIKGVHFYSTSWHHDWLKDEKKQREIESLFKRMRLSWVTLLSDGTSVLQEFVDLTDGKKKPAVQWFLDRQIVPIVREQGKMNYRFTADVQGLVQAFKPYDMKPQIIPGNEFGDEREWVNHKVPKDWKERCVARFHQAVSDIVGAGALCLFPDPLADWDWWFEQLRHLAPMFQSRDIGIAAHLYGVGRPPDYPYGPEIQQRRPITLEEWREALDDFVDDPYFTEKTVEMINKCRATWANPTTVFDDPTCFGAWRVIREAARKWFNTEVAMCMTEGGWTPRDNAHRDDRYPYTTPKQVGRYTLDVFRATGHGMYAITPWVLGGGGWYTENWTGGAYSDVIDQNTGEPYGYDKPVVRMLENDTEPPGTPGVDLSARLRLLSSRLGEVRDLWRQVQEALSSIPSL